MQEIEQILNHKFKNANLLKRALTHSSKSAENYERLEYLGDSILDFLVGDWLFKNTTLNEGQLTVLRSHFVSENYLDEVFESLGLEKFAITGKSMGKTIPKAVKADMIEAIIAAIYLDSGLENAKAFIERNFHLDGYASVQDTNYKSRLQELVQAGFKCAMKYVTTKTESGFSASFYMDEDLIASAEGLDKQSAEQACAQKAIKVLFKE